MCWRRAVLADAAAPFVVAVEGTSLKLSSLPPNIDIDEEIGVGLWSCAFKMTPLAVLRQPEHVEEEKAAVLEQQGIAIFLVVQVLVLLVLVLEDATSLGGVEAR